MEEKSKNSIKTAKKVIGKPFEKGKTGNPDGRPLGQKNYATLYREALIKLAKLNDKEPEELELELISKGIMSARSGDYRFYKDVLDRLLGTAMNNTNLNVAGSLSISFDDAFAPKTKGNSTV
jgi:hypothetical protein